MQRMRSVMRAALFAILFAWAPAPATAGDADPVHVRRWLCTFFNAADDARPNLLPSAPLPFQRGSVLVHEQTQRTNSVADSWSVGRRFSDWRVAYNFQTRRDRRYGFDLDIEGARTILLPDEPSVLAFLAGFEAPTFDAELSTYHSAILDPSLPADDPLVEVFTVEFDLARQDLSLSWLLADAAVHGKRFCS